MIFPLRKINTNAFISGFILALKPARLQWSDDGSIESLDYGDVYFQREKGLEESRYVFLQGNNLAARFAALQDSFSIGETGFGSGLNFLLTAQLFAETAPADARLVYASIEKHPLRKDDLARLYALLPQLGPLADEVLAQYPPLIEGFHTLYLLGGRIRLLLLFGDIAVVLPQLEGRFDAWFLDGFSPAKNPEMWVDALYADVAARTKPGGSLATFSSAGHVRRNLKAAGFNVRKIKGFGFKWSMTVAQMPGDPLPAPVQKKIAVLGAGIAGCAVAAAFARRGDAVALLDATADMAQGASGNPAAIVYPKLVAGESPMAAFHAHAFSLARNMLNALRPASWRACGVLHKNVTPEDTDHADNIMARNDFPDDYAVQQAEGIFQPSAGFLSPVEWCQLLAAHKNITRHFCCRIETLEKTETGWKIDGADGFVLEADVVVIALGNGSLKITETSWLPLQSFRGQVTLLKQTAASATLGHVICHDGYITPATNGLHCIGATFQKEDFAETAARADDDAENLTKLQANLPQFGFAASDVAGHRAGFRAATPDKIPMIGQAPDRAAMISAYKNATSRGPALPPAAYIDGLYVATGFGAHGMTGAPLAAELIAAMVSDEPLPVPASLRAQLAPERFIFRALKRGEI